MKAGFSGAMLFARVILPICPILVKATSPFLLDRCLLNFVNIKFGMSKMCIKAGFSGSIIFYP
jgi:hypothetical protein